MSDENVWGAAPAESRWWGEVICSSPDGDQTEDFSGYSASEERPSWHGLVPEGWKKLEARVLMTQGHPKYKRRKTTDD